MDIEPLQDSWSRAIRGAFGALIGLAVALAAWCVDGEGGPSFASLATGFAVVFALGMAIFGDGFWRAIRDGTRGV